MIVAERKPHFKVAAFAKDMLKDFLDCNTRKKYNTWNTKVGRVAHWSTQRALLGLPQISLHRENFAASWKMPRRALRRSAARSSWVEKEYRFSKDYLNVLDLLFIKYPCNTAWRWHNGPFCAGKCCTKWKFHNVRSWTRMCCPGMVSLASSYADEPLWARATFYLCATLQ